MPLLADRGLPAEVLALQAVGGKLPWKLQTSAGDILSELLGGEEEVEASVELVHDPDWQDFPELGEAVKAAVGEEVSTCLAICEERGVWAVGLAGKWKVREPTARLALCCALASQLDLDAFVEFAANRPELAAVNEEMGAVPEGYAPAPAAKRRRSSNNTATNGHAREPAASRSEASAGEAVDEPASPAAPGVQRTLPKDVPLWIQLPEDAERPPVIDGLAAEALVVSTDGNKRKALYSRADEALQRLLLACGVEEEDLKDAVEYQDDFDWKQFPMVGKELKRIAPAEECLCVAACPALGVWAVGVCMKGQARYRAAKAALAGALAMHAGEAGADVDLAGELTSVAEFVEEVRRAHETFVDGEQPGYAGEEEAEEV